MRNAREMALWFSTGNTHENETRVQGHCVRRQRFVCKGQRRVTRWLAAWPAWPQHDEPVLLHTNQEASSVMIGQGGSKVCVRAVQVEASP